MVKWFFPDEDTENYTLVERVRDWVGRAWGYASTQGLALLIGFQGILLDPTARSAVSAFPWFPRVTLVLAIVILLLRHWAPPAQAITVRKEDKVVVSDDKTTVTIQKPAPIDDKAAVDKPAGETVDAAIKAAK